MTTGINGRAFPLSDRASDHISHYIVRISSLPCTATGAGTTSFDMPKKSGSVIYTHGAGGRACFDLESIPTTLDWIRPRRPTSDMQFIYPHSKLTSFTHLAFMPCLQST